MYFPIAIVAAIFAVPFLALASPVMKPREIENTDLDPRASPRAPRATVYYSCQKEKQAALTFDDGPYDWL